MLILKTNTNNLLARIFCVIFLIAVGFPMVNLAFQDPKMGHIIFWKIKLIYIFCIFLLFMFLFVVQLVVSILGIIKVQVDEISGSITLTALFSKTIIETKDIESYFLTTHKNQFKVWNGILLTLKYGGSIQLPGQNIKSISDFRDYLNDRKVAYSGERKMKFPFN